MMALFLLSFRLRRCYAVAHKEIVIVICRRISIFGVACMRLEICPQVSSPASVLLSSICTVLYATISSEVGALRRLRQFLVGGCGHVSSNLDENGLHCEVAFPVCYAWEFGEVDLWWDIDVSMLYFESRVSLIVVVGLAVPCHCFR
jgi:hypothetical protein